jgi:hypothetical protein
MEETYQKKIVCLNLLTIQEYLSFCRHKGKVQKPEAKSVASNGSFCTFNAQAYFNNTKGSDQDESSDINAAYSNHEILGNATEEGGYTAQ